MCSRGTRHLVCVYRAWRGTGAQRHETDRTVCEQGMLERSQRTVRGHPRCVHIAVVALSLWGVRVEEPSRGGERADAQQLDTGEPMRHLELGGHVHVGTCE